jgi:hypothetical protein
VKNPQRKRHRWKSLDTYLPNKNWICTSCGLLKVAEYDSDNLYRMPARKTAAKTRNERTWYRFAPPCPPDEEAVA